MKIDLELQRTTKTFSWTVLSVLVNVEIYSFLDHAMIITTSNKSMHLSHSVPLEGFLIDCFPYWCHRSDDICIY